MKYNNKLKPIKESQPNFDNDPIIQYDDHGLNFLDDLGNEFDSDTKRKVFNDYLKIIKKETGEYPDINELSDTFHRENVYEMLLKLKKGKK